MPPSMGFIGKILSWETFSGGGIISFSSSWLERNSIRKGSPNGKFGKGSGQWSNDETLERFMDFT